MAADIYKCKSCEQPFTNKNCESITCNFCDDKLHLTCVNITASAYKQFEKIERAFWVCEDCIPDKKDMKILNKRLMNIEKILMDQSEMLKDHSEKIMNIKVQTPRTPNINFAQQSSLSNTPLSALLGKKRTFSQVISENERANSAKKVRTDNMQSEKKDKKERDKSVIYIQPKIKSKKTVDDAKRDIKSLLDPNVDPILGLKNLAKDKMVIQCKDAASANAIFDKLDPKMKNDFDLRKSERKWPQLMISGVDPGDFVDEQQFIKLLRANNDVLVENSQLKFIKVLNKNRNVVIETDIDTRNKLMEKKIIRIGWMLCSLTEYVQVLRCYNCHSFGHSATNCTNEKVCSICTGKHDSSMCENEQYICINCTNFNEIRQIGEKMLDVNHPVFSIKCPIYRHKIEAKRKKVQYYD